MTALPQPDLTDEDERDGLTRLREHPRVVLGTLAAVAGLGLFGWLTALARMEGLGALGHQYSALGTLAAFNIHVVSGLALPFALLTQLSQRVTERHAQVWVAGAVANWALLGVSTVTGAVLSAGEPHLGTRIGLYWSVALLGLIWVWLKVYFVRGEWLHYRLWVARSAVGLILRVPFRFFVAITFALTGSDELAGSIGYWSALLVALILVEWVLLPMVWRPKRNVTQLRYPPGTVIIEEGEPGLHMYVVDEGSVEVTTRGHRGELRQLAVLEAGAWFGEMALVNDAPCSATVTATTDVVVTRIDRRGFHNLLGSLAPLRDAVLKTMAGYVPDGHSVDSRG
ncbi:MAG: hypothetical protein ACI8PZ_005110 [Myxococcota bacterium]|jgi:hypothetical protein